MKLHMSFERLHEPGENIAVNAAFGVFAVEILEVIYVHEGDLVKKGQPILDFDNEKQAQEVENLRAQLKRKKEVVAKIRETIEEEKADGEVAGEESVVLGPTPIRTAFTPPSTWRPPTSPRQGIRQRRGPTTLPCPRGPRRPMAPIRSGRRRPTASRSARASTPTRTRTSRPSPTAMPAIRWPCCTR